MRHAQLRAFHHVALSGGFSRAAAMLGLTQPAISDQVKKLEREHDVQLFRRSTKQVLLTELGEQLLDITRRLFDIEAQAEELLSESRALRLGRLAIMADSAHHILHVLGRFRAALPDIPVTVNSGNSAQILKGLENYEVDIGVVGEVPEDRTFDVIRLNAAPIVAFARSGGPLDRRRSIPLKTLLSLPLVMREEGSKTRAKLEIAARTQGLSVSAAIEAEGRDAVREIVGAGGGVGIVSRAELQHDAQLTVVPVTDPKLSMEEAIVCLRARADSRLIRTFMDMARHTTP